MNVYNAFYARAITLLKSPESTIDQLSEENDLQFQLP